MQLISRAGQNLLLLCSLSSFTYAQQILVPPYIQPGNVSTLAREEKVLIWQTDSVSGSFKVEYVNTSSNKAKPVSAKIIFDKLVLNNKTTLLYRAQLSKLQFDQRYNYYVSLNGKLVAENTFTSRSKKSNTRFVVFGDIGQGTKQQAAIAYQVYQQKPQFVLVTGDNVYGRGLANEYHKNFFPYYTNPIATDSTGAPLMSTLPFYMLVGNHDTYGSNLDKYPDGLAYFYFNDLPLNAPVPKLTLEVTGNANRVSEFRKNAGSRFPRTTNFSFDYGNVHITCLDANLYVNPVDPDLVAWMAEDIRNTKADWKIVAYHHPAFNSSKAHYDDQQMRLIAPILEALKVDLVLTGHVHNYQRTVPLKFEPKLDSTGTRYVITKEGRVDGTFALDQKFDGTSITKPNGIIYIVTGAGGAGLYDKQFTNNPDLWKHDPPENWAPFTVKMISDIHSFTLIETNEQTLTLKQVDSNGTVIDQMRITR